MASEPLPFSLEGSVSAAVRNEMAVIANETLNHPWCGEGPRLVVISDNIAKARKQYLSSEKLKDIDGRSDDLPGVGFGGMDKDGKPIAVLMQIADESMLIWLFGHEFLEAAISSHHRSLGFAEPTDGQSKHAAALWGDYVVERINMEIAARHDRKPVDLNQRTVVQQATDLRTKVAPTQASDHDFGMLTLSFARASGRADGGSAADANDINSFMGHPIAQAGSWQNFRTELQSIYQSPRKDPNSYTSGAWDRWAELHGQFTSEKWLKHLGLI